MRREQGILAIELQTCHASRYRRVLSPGTGRHMTRCQNAVKMSSAPYRSFRCVRHAAHDGECVVSVDGERFLVRQSPEERAFVLAMSEWAAAALEAAEAS